MCWLRFELSACQCTLVGIVGVDVSSVVGVDFVWLVVFCIAVQKRQKTALGRDDLYDDHKLEEMMTSRQRYFSTDRGRYTTGYVDRLQQYSAADRDKYRGQDRHRQKPSYQGITTSSLRLY